MAHGKLTVGGVLLLVLTSAGYLAPPSWADDKPIVGKPIIKKDPPPPPKKDGAGEHSPAFGSEGPL